MCFYNGSLLCFTKRSFLITMNDLFHAVLLNDEELLRRFENLMLTLICTFNPETSHSIENLVVCNFLIQESCGVLYEY